MLTTNRLTPRRTAWDLFHQVQDDFHRELSDWFSAAGSAARAPLGVWTKGNQAIVAIEAPGLEPENIDVSIHRDVVSIEARPTPDSGLDNVRFIRRERTGGAVKRQVQLPFELDTEQVEASYERGLLILRLKAHASAEPAKITVKAG